MRKAEGTSGALGNSGYPGSGLIVVASIMLPLGFLTGLLGINFGGIPAAETPWAFAAVCAILAAVVAVQVVLFRRLRWL